MKYKLFILLILFSSLLADEIQLYGGKLEVGSNKGVYEGGIYISKSEDETIQYKLGLKKVNLNDDSDFKQTETFISIKREIDLDKYFEFAFQGISNDVNNGNIYIFNWYKNDKIDYKIGGSFSNYNTDKIYQFNVLMNSFIKDSSFYIEPTYYLIDVIDDKIYNALNLKLGYIKGKSDIYFSFLGGKNRYLVIDDSYYSCDFGYTTKYNYKFSYAYQFNVNFLLKTSFYFYKFENVGNMKVYNIALSYKY